MTDRPTSIASTPAPPVADPSAPLAPSRPAGTRVGFASYLGLAGALLVMIILFSLLSSHFLTYDTFSTIANQIPDLVVMSVGMTFVLIIAGIDLSVGSVLALAASGVSVAMLKWGWGVFPSALFGMVAAALAGTVTGAVTVGWRIPSFIVSLGVLEMARGVAYQMTDSRTGIHRGGPGLAVEPHRGGHFAGLHHCLVSDGHRAAGADTYGFWPLSDRALAPTKRASGWRASTRSPTRSRCSP